MEIEWWEVVCNDWITPRRDGSLNNDDCLRKRWIQTASYHNLILHTPRRACVCSTGLYSVFAYVFWSTLCSTLGYLRHYCYDCSCSNSTLCVGHSFLLDTSVHLLLVLLTAWTHLSSSIYISISTDAWEEQKEKRKECYRGKYTREQEYVLGKCNEPSEHAYRIFFEEMTIASLGTSTTTERSKPLEWFATAVASVFIRQRSLTTTRCLPDV